MNLIEPELSERAIKRFSGRVMRRLRSAGETGRGFCIEDIQQELRMAWVLASKNYSEGMGIPFQAYFAVGMRNHINRLIEKQVGRRHDEVVAFSLDAKLNNDEGDGASFGDAIADEKAVISSAYEDDQFFQHVTKKISPRTRQYLTLLREQPPEIMEEVLKLRVRSDYAREKMNMSSAANDHLMSWMIFDIMGSSSKERAEIIKEARALGQRVCEANK